VPRPGGQSRSAAHAKVKGAVRVRKTSMGAATARATARPVATRAMGQFAQDHCRLVIMAKRRRRDGMSIEDGVGGCFRSSFRTGRAKNGFAQPAESQAGDGDSQLHAVADTAELLVKLRRCGRGAVPRSMWIGFAHADQRNSAAAKKALAATRAG